MHEGSWRELQNVENSTHLSERSPSQKKVKTFDVTPPGEEARINNPAAWSGWMLKAWINTKAEKGNRKNLKKKNIVQTQVEQIVKGCLQKIFHRKVFLTFDQRSITREKSSGNVYLLRDHSCQDSYRTLDMRPYLIPGDGTAHGKHNGHQKYNNQYVMDLLEEWRGCRCHFDRSIRFFQTSVDASQARVDKS